MIKINKKDDKVTFMYTLYALSLSGIIKRNNYTHLVLVPLNVEKYLRRNGAG